MTGVNHRDMNTKNKYVILKALATQGAMPRNELSMLSGLSKMAVTAIANEYMEQGSDVSQDYRRHTTSHFEAPEESVEREELTKVLGEALLLLTEKEQKVITLYYYEELTLKEISSILEVSESRVSQLHTRALKKMKGKMGNYMGILSDN